MWNLFIITTILVFRVSAQAQNQTEPVAILSGNFHQLYVPDEIAEFSCNATGNPNPRISWSFRKFNGYTIEMLNSINEHQEGTSRTSTLRFQVQSGGDIICIARNRLGFNSVSREIFAAAKPVAILSGKPQKIYMPGEIAVFSCNATGNPNPEITWSFQGFDSPTPQILNSTGEYLEGKSLSSTVRFQVQSRGHVICSARNEAGRDTDEQKVLVTAEYGPLEKPNCGIVEKEDAEREMFPWVVQIISSNNDGSKWYHAGSLISARHVLTSAQVNDGVYTPSQVGLGDPADRKWVGVEKTSQHPRYDYDEGYDYDIAVIRLEEDVKFTRFIQPICLPAPSEVFGANFIGKELFFAKMEQDCEDHLKVAPTIKVMEKASCEHIMNNTICTSRFDTRRYNIGGPFMYIHTDTYYYHLSLYTEARTIPDTIAYLDWIKSELNWNKNEND